MKNWIDSAAEYEEMMDLTLSDSQRIIYAAGHTNAVIDRQAQLKAKDEEIKAFKEKLESDLEYATNSSDREDFNIPTRRYWQVKAEVLADVIEYLNM